MLRVSAGTALLCLCPSWMELLGGKVHRAPACPQGAPEDLPPAPSSHSQLRFAGRVLDIHPWGRLTSGLEVALHPADPSISQHLFLHHHIHPR